MDEPEEKPLSESFATSIQHPQSLVVHITALRKHFFRAFIVLFILTALSFVYTKKILNLLSQPIGGMASLQAIDVTEPIGVFMRVALLSGFSLALPYIVFEMWLFAAPGLKRRARFTSLFTIPVATFFFMSGMAFAYFIMLPAALPFLLNLLGVPTIPRPSSYIRFVTGLMFWIGVAFEYPLVVYGFAGFGLVTAKTLKDNWRIAVVIIAVFSAAITPTVDPINMGLVMLPMVILYFLGVGLAALAGNRRKKSRFQG